MSFTTNILQFWNKNFNWIHCDNETKINLFSGKASSHHNLQYIIILLFSWFGWILTHFKNLNSKIEVEVIIILYLKSCSLPSDWNFYISFKIQVLPLLRLPCPPPTHLFVIQISLLCISIASYANFYNSNYNPIL